MSSPTQPSPAPSRRLIRRSFGERAVIYLGVPRRLISTYGAVGRHKLYPVENPSFRKARAI